MTQLIIKQHLIAYPNVKGNLNNFFLKKRQSTQIFKKRNKISLTQEANQNLYEERKLEMHKMTIIFY